MKFVLAQATATCKFLLSSDEFNVCFIISKNTLEYWFSEEFQEVSKKVRGVTGGFRGVSWGFGGLQTLNPTRKAFLGVSKYLQRVLEAIQGLQGRIQGFWRTSVALQRFQ